MSTTTDWLDAFFPNGIFDSDIAWELAQSLRRGTTGLDVLEALIRHSDGRIRDAAAYALYETGNPVSRFLPAVWIGLNDSTCSVRYWCVLALEGVHHDNLKPAVVLRVIRLLKDSYPAVRRAVLDVIRHFGQDVFEQAMSTDPRCLDIPAHYEAEISGVQAELREGYHAARRREALQGLRGLGHAIRIGFECGRRIDALSEAISGASPDVRRHLQAAVIDIAWRGLDILRALAADEDPIIRAHSWGGVRRLTSQVRRWQRELATAASDNDPRVRAAYFSHLTYGVPDTVVESVIAASINASDETACSEALYALKEMLQAATLLAKISKQTVERFLRAMHESGVSEDLRERYGDVAQAYASFIEAIRTAPGRAALDDIGQRPDSHPQ